MRSAPHKDHLTQARVLRRPVENGNGNGDSDWGEVADVQRARMLTAMIDIAARDGLANASVAHVVARAGVSRRTFYEVFTDREDCFLSAFDDALARTARHVLPAYDQPGDWIDRVRAGLTALLEYFDDQPAVARVLIIESLAGGPKALQRRATVITDLVNMLQKGYAQSEAGQALPALVAEGTIGAVLAIIHARLLEHKRSRLIELRNPLMGVIALSYLGAAAAQLEALQPVPKRRRRVTQPSNDAIGELQMRLTYRTLRVLAAVAANPGASNRTLAELADITDQGQISKLLARLERLDLIQNTRAQARRGDPNAWHLTETGTEIENVIAGQVSRV